MRLQLLLIVTILVTIQAETSKRYPQDALYCYSTSSPNEKLICPEDRSAYCIKEVLINATRLECGSNKDFPNDSWSRQEAKCIYRKCGASCPIEIKQVENDRGEILQRESHCCKSNLCNASTRLAAKVLLPLLIVVASAFG